jgi:hypothetical protein
MPDTPPMLLVVHTDVDPAVYEFEREEDRKTPEYASVRGFGALTPNVSNTTIGVFRKIFEYEKPKAT